MKVQFRDKVKKGKWADSPMNPNRRKPKKDRFVTKKEKKVTDVNGVVRRQMAEEVGKDELSRDKKFALLQKYGIVAARIDRKIERPKWMEMRVWNQMKNEFYRATKNLVPAQQEKRNPRPYRGNREADKQRQQSWRKKLPQRSPRPPFAS